MRQAAEATKQENSRTYSIVRDRRGEAVVSPRRETSSRAVLPGIQSKGRHYRALECDNTEEKTVAILIWIPLVDREGNVEELA